MTPTERYHNLAGLTTRFAGDLDMHKLSKVTDCYHQRMDLSNGYESVSEEFLARRGNSRTRSIAIGVKEVRKWAKTLPRGGSVIDLDCGPGFPITVVLVEEGLHVFGVD